MKIGDQPAFPTATTGHYSGGNCGKWIADQDGGMTYRQWLIGMIACSDGTDEDWVIERADAIIAKLEKESA